MKYCVGLPSYVFEFDDTKDNFKTWLECNIGSENVLWRYILGNGTARGICFDTEEHLFAFTTTFNIMDHKFKL